MAGDESQVEGWLRAREKAIPLRCACRAGAHLVPIWRPHHRRLVGELMRWMDLGELGGNEMSEILPGGYAVLGAAAMAAGVTRTFSPQTLFPNPTLPLPLPLPVPLTLTINLTLPQVTRTISSAIVVFELTGGLIYLLPLRLTLKAHLEEAGGVVVKWNVAAFGERRAEAAKAAERRIAAARAAAAAAASAAERSALNAVPEAEAEAEATRARCEEARAEAAAATARADAERSKPKPGKELEELLSAEAASAASLAEAERAVAKAEAAVAEASRRVQHDAKAAADARQNLEAATARAAQLHARSLLSVHEDPDRPTAATATASAEELRRAFAAVSIALDPSDLRALYAHLAPAGRPGFKPRQQRALRSAARSFLLTRAPPQRPEPLPHSSSPPLGGPASSRGCSAL